MNYKSKYLKYKKKYLDLKNIYSSGGTRKLYNLQIPCKNLSDNHNKCLKRPDCYLKKNKRISRKKKKKGKTSNLICVRKNNIPLDFQQIQKLFLGRGLCWLHTSIIALFISDIFRDEVWQKCFVLKKFKDLIIPTQTKFIDDNIDSEGLFYYTIVDLIRIVLMQMFQNISLNNSEKLKMTYTFEKNNISKNVLEKCNDTIYEIIRDLAKTLIERPDEDNFIGRPYIFTREFLGFFNLEFEKVKVYFPSENNQKNVFNKNNLKKFNLNNFEIFFTESNNLNGIDHVLLFFKFNNQWCFYDNNIGTVLKIDNINNNDTLLNLIENVIKSKKVKTYYKKFHDKIFNSLVDIIAIKSTTQKNLTIQNEYLKLERINYISEKMYQKSFDNYINTILTTENYYLLEDLMKLFYNNNFYSLIKLYNKNEKIDPVKIMSIINKIKEKMRIIYIDSKN
jgi:hypothetical protein